MGKHTKKSPRDMRQANYDVGYGKPPTHTRWSKGMSGNPSGKRKRPPTFEECVHEELSRLFPAKEGRRTRLRDVRRLLIRRLINDAMAGDNKAAKLLMDMDPYVLPTDDEEDIIEFTLILEDDDPGPHWQRIRNGRVIDQG